MGILDQFNLAGQCAIITGAGTGLGREMALSLADAGCDIVGVGRRAGPIEEVGEKLRGMMQWSKSNRLVDRKRN